MDYTFYKLSMTKQDKLDAIKTLQQAILELKLSPEAKSKKTIQKLQQKLDELTSWFIKYIVFIPEKLDYNEWYAAKELVSALYQSGLLIYYIQTILQR